MSRLGLAVRDECGVEAVELLDQCGPGQVRLAPSTQHMEHIMQVRDSPQSYVSYEAEARLCSYVPSFN